jgi:hypothetical protein
LARKTFAVLIVGYQRVDAIRSILEQCLAAEVRNVLLSLDFPKVVTTETLGNNARIRNLVVEYETKFDSFLSRFLDVNIGCSANVLSSCDWAFNQYEAVAVLEDDCKPSLGFFEFCEDSKGFLKKNNHTLLACGTQFVPVAERGSFSVLSKYALTWGWFTNADHWKAIKSEIGLLSHERGMNLNSFNYERVYWREGARRAYQGYVDVWDTALLAVINQGPYFALLPPSNLITNIGNDSVATHTGADKMWTNAAPEKYELEDFGIPAVNLKVDLWLKENLYKISFRHLFSTRITRIRDFFRKPKLDELLKRWGRASKL